MNNFSHLPRSSTYMQQLLPFFLPYALYTGLGMLNTLGIAEWQIQLAKLVTVAVTLLYFRKHYSFGRFKITYLIVSLFFTPLALGVWAYPLYFFVSVNPGQPDPASLTELPCAEIYFYLRLVNSVILVAIFEELLCRIYLLEFLYQAGNNKSVASFIDRLLSPLDLKPSILDKLPFSTYSLVGSTIFFMMGHSVNSYVSAILYFSLTNVLYWRTGSLWVCVFVHAFTNLAIAILVNYYNMNFLWF